MINPEVFHNLLSAQGTGFFTGVPDSLLKSICAYITSNVNEKNHIIAVNEGAAIGLGAGYHLATGNIPLVYMQNSGIGNAVNPLLSLADSDVYRIPMLLLVGWRGEPGTKDEPQHVKQGKVTCALFDAMGIPWEVLSESEDELKNQIKRIYSQIKNDNAPFALIVKKDTFAPYSLAANENEKNPAQMSREEAIETIILSSQENEVFVSTTGGASRELFELRKKHNMGHKKDFLTVGSMGHASSLALSIALNKPQQPVTCIDGDGAALMHLGSMAEIGVQKPSNLRHIVLNNNAHDSVGGQPTIAGKIDICAIARGCAYAKVLKVKTKDELEKALAEKDKPLFIEVLVRKGSRKDLGRPDTSAQENKNAFMQFLSGGK